MTAMVSGNPFVPCFGVPPYVLAGREDFLSEMSDVLNNGFYLKSSTSMLFGVRGVGKTVLLRTVEKRAVEKGWSVIAVSPSSREGLMGRLIARAAYTWTKLQTQHRLLPRRKISSVQAFGVGATLQPPQPTSQTQYQPDLETLLSDIARLHQQIEGGLLITIDEAHVAGADEVRDFARIFQHCRGQHLPLVFLGAGLPHLSQALRSGEETTFLQRCKWHDIGRLSRKETRKALHLTLTQGGGSVPNAGLEQMTDTCDGHPYMIQLAGANVWSAAADPTHITLEEVEQGLLEASAELGPEVYGPIWDDMSTTDKKLAVAMLYRSGPSNTSDISDRWGASKSSFYTYRTRLMDSGLIRPETKGSITFSHPSARTLILEKAKTEGWHLTPNGIPIPPTKTTNTDIAADISDMITEPTPDTTY